MNNERVCDYESPKVEVISIEVEKGYYASIGGESDDIPFEY